MFTDVTRSFSRYGLLPDQVARQLAGIPRPDLILLTSMMTYWYPGVRETLDLVRRIFPGVPVLLGGVYATLYPGHAKKNMNADEVITGPGESPVLDATARLTGWDPGPGPDPENMASWPLAAQDLGDMSFVPVLTSRGCPFQCAYCASGLLEPVFRRRDPDSVAREIRFFNKKYGVRHFAFYDDALIVDAPNHLLVFLEKILEWDLDLRFHTPNAVHVRYLTPDVAGILFKAGFETLRLGLETARFTNREKLDAKVTENEFQQAAGNLKKAGFDARSVGAYLLIGLPEQDYKAVEDSVIRVKDAGIRPILTHYSPIPGTRLWEAAKKASRYDLEKDPLYTNRAVFPCQKEPFSWRRLSDLKKLALP